MEEENTISLQKCKNCKYAVTVREYWENELKNKKATIILKTVTFMLLLQTAIINTILLFKK